MNYSRTAYRSGHALALALLALCSTAAANAGPKVNEILAEIQARGAAEVVGRIWNTPDWDYVLAKVETGRRAWIIIAVKLYPGTDAGATEMLALALGEALVRAPRDVLIQSASTFGVESICSGPDVDDPRYETRDRAVAAVAHRVTAVSKLHGSDVAALRASCLTALEDEKALLVRDNGPYS